MKLHNFTVSANFRSLIFMSMLAMTSACGVISESNFSLRSDCRIPKWFSPATSGERSSVAVQFDMYVGLQGRYSKIKLYDMRHEVISEVTGKIRDIESISLRSSSGSQGWTTYDVITANGITDVVTYIYAKGEPVQLCMVDDPGVLKDLGVFP